MLLQLRQQVSGIPVDGLQAFGELIFAILRLMVDGKNLGVERRHALPHGVHFLLSLEAQISHAFVARLQLCAQLPYAVCPL